MRFRRIAILFPGLLAGALCGASPTVLDLTTAAGAVKVEGNIGSCPRNGRLELTVPAASGLYAEKGLFPNIRFAPRNGKYFDFSEAGVLAAEVENLSPYPIDIVLEIQGELPDGRKALSKSGIALNAGEKSVLRHRFSPVVNTSFAPGGVFDPFPGFPNPRRPDPARITRIVLMCRRPMREFRFAVSPFVAEAPPERPAAALASPAAFYPCIDRFGQYRHADWPGKIRREADFAAAREREESDLAAHPPGTAGRTVYGGWADGPTLKATGHFRVEKYRGKWFFVDPAGKLFWSFGIDCLYPANPTCVDGRREYFEWLPERDDPKFGGLYGVNRRSSAFYRKKGIETPRTFDFHLANLLRKYGDCSPEQFARIAARRLLSWSFNTMGNWNTAEVRRICRMPYVVQAKAAGSPLLGTAPYNLYDVFEPGFQAAIEADMKREFRAALDDPYCIGFFVDNEVRWDKLPRLAEHVIAMPAETPARRALAARLKEKYRTIAALNRAWGTGYPGWDGLGRLPAGKRIPEADCRDFNRLALERYYRSCRDAVRNAAPRKLYLGSRFAGFQTLAAAEAEAEYADVVSANLYYRSIAHYTGVADKPLLVGEFHFGTTVAGAGSPGLQEASGREECAKAFTRYCESALYNPNCVGVHYFRYADQPVSGRTGDDENMQVGFVDGCDTPNQPMIDAARRIGNRLYEIRLKR